MGAVNADDGRIRRVFLLGDNFPAPSIIEALSKAGLEVHVVRQHKSFTSLPNVSYHHSKITSDVLIPLLLEVMPDLLINTVHGGAFDNQKQIIDTAIAAGIPRYIPHEFGQDSLNTQIQVRLPPARERARVVEYLRQQSLYGNINWLGIATGATLDRGVLRGDLGFDLKWQSATLHGQGHEKFAASSSAWIGRVVEAAVKHWDSVKDRYIYAAGLITSADAIVAGLEKETGKTWAVGRSTDPAQCVREAEQRITRGFPDAGMFLMQRSVLYDETLQAVGPFESESANEILGLGTSESLHDVLHEVIHHFESDHGRAQGCGCD